MFANETHQQAHETLKSGKIEEAIVLYSKALEQNPESVNIISDRGVAYLHLKDKKACFADLDLAVKMQPNYSFRYACRAFARNNFGDINGAIEDYQKAIELDPDDAVAHNNLGMLLEQKGYKEEAEKKFKRADSLSKQEDHLLELVDDLDGKEEDNQETTEAPSTNEQETIDPNIEREENIQYWKEMKKIVTSKKEFRAFLDYILNGFKTK